MTIETEFRDVDPRAIVVPKDRLRAARSEDDQHTMDTSIERFGVMQEVGVRIDKGVPVLIYGEGRLQTELKSGKEQIRVKVWHCSEDDAELLALAENLGRGAIRPGEYVRKITSLLKEKGMSAADVAKLINRSEQWVRDLVGVSELSGEIVEDVVMGTLTLEHAKQLRRVEDPEKRDECYRLTMQGSWNADALKRFINHWVFKRCDGCGKDGQDLTKVGSELLCLECIRARYPQLAAELDKAPEKSIINRQKIVEGAKDAAKPMPVPMDVCHVCGKETELVNIQQLIGCKVCMAKIQRVLAMFDVYLGKPLREISMEDLRTIRLSERGGGS